MSESSFGCYSFRRELKCGTAIYNSENNKIGYSKAAAQKGISQVIISRVFMAIPGMCEYTILKTDMSTHYITQMRGVKHSMILFSSFHTFCKLPNDSNKETRIIKNKIS